MRFCVFSSIYRNWALRNLNQNLEILSGYRTISHNNLTTIDLINDIFRNIFFNPQWRIFLWVLITVVWIKESLCDENIHFKIGFTFFYFFGEYECTFTSLNFNSFTLIRCINMAWCFKWNSHERYHSNHLSMILVTEYEFWGEERRC